MRWPESSRRGSRKHVPKKKRNSAPSDHLSTALQSLRDNPQPLLALGAKGKILPLDYLSTLGIEPEAGPVKAREPKQGGKIRMAFNLPRELCERARNTVWHLSDVLSLNLSNLAESTLERELKRLEKKHNDGKPFPRRQGRLRGGRPPRPRRGVRHRQRKTAQVPS